MGRCAVGFALAAAMWGTAALGGERPMKVFILAGQSNMFGQGRSAELPAELKGAHPRVFRLSEGKWTPLRPDWSFGPEVTFGRAMAEAFPNSRIGIVKLAKGSTSLMAWSPGWKPEFEKITADAREPLYGKLMEQVKSAMKMPGVEIAGMLWMQGERDSCVGHLAPKYAERLRLLVEAVRRDTKRPGLPFIFGRIANGRASGYNHVEVVRRQMTAFRMPGVRMIDTDDVPHRPDNLHYNSAGQRMLGLRFAGAMVEMLKAGAGPRAPQAGGR